jgi:hypothetical protein
MKLTTAASVAAAAFLTTSRLYAVPPVIDGNLDASYGTAIQVQQNATAWGAGNVLANAYYFAGPTSFDLFIGGRPSGNAFLFFFDTVAGGQNTLNNSQGGGDAYQLNNLNGFTFDSGFQADYMLRIYGDGGVHAYVNFFDLAGNANSYLGDANPGPIVSGGMTFAQAFADVTGPYSSVTTGFEVSIPYSVLGLTGPEEAWQLSAILANGGSDYLSNQELGSLPSGTGDVGSDHGNWNQNLFPGSQILQIPEPSALALLGLGGLAILTRRLRR